MAVFEVKDSGKREEYDSGMVRDTQEGKPDYTLIDPVGLERVAIHLVKGAEKYGRDNWRKANSEAELTRFKSSALRHIFQWLRGDTDEDHMAAVVFNLFAAEYVKSKLNNPIPYIPKVGDKVIPIDKNNSWGEPSVAWFRHGGERQGFLYVKPPSEHTPEGYLLLGVGFQDEFGGDYFLPSNVVPYV